MIIIGNFAGGKAGLFRISMAKKTDGNDEDKEYLNYKYKDEKSEGLFLSLSQKEGEDYYDAINELVSRVVSERA